MSTKTKASISKFFSPNRSKSTKKQKQAVKKEAKLEVEHVEAVEVQKIVEVPEKENVEPTLSPKIEPVNVEKVSKISPVKAEPASPQPEKPETVEELVEKSSEKSVENVPAEKLSTEKPSTEIKIEDLPTLPSPSGDDSKDTSKPTKTNKITKKSTKPKKQSSEDEDYVPETSKSSSKSKKDKNKLKEKDSKKSKLKQTISKITESVSKESIKSKSKAKSKKKKEIELSPNQKKITDFNFIRRSRRVPTAEKRKIEEEQLKFYLANSKDEKLEHIVMKMTEGKGRGIFANKDLQKGDFVVEYAGDLMSLEEGVAKEQEYSEDAEIGCYIYFFSFKGKRYCIDATAESGRYGRLLNHSKQRANCKTRLVEEPEGIPRLIIEAKTDISKDEELLYDYGDRSQKALKAHPWLKE